MMSHGALSWNSNNRSVNVPCPRDCPYHARLGTDLSDIANITITPAIQESAIYAPPTNLPTAKTVKPILSQSGFKVSAPVLVAGAVVLFLLLK